MYILYDEQYMYILQAKVRLPIGQKVSLRVSPQEPSLVVANNGIN